VCLLEIVYREHYGCTTKVVRKELENHKELKVLEHCKLMLQSLDHGHLTEYIKITQNVDRLAHRCKMELDRTFINLKYHLILLLIVIVGFYGIKSQEEYLNRLGSIMYLRGLMQFSSRPPAGYGTEASYDIAPVILKMPGFRQKLWKKKEWISNPFYAFPKGYLVYLKVDAAGIKEGENKFMSVSLILMKGPYDDRLEKLGYWPMCGKFEVKLLNQFNDHDHYTRTLMSNYDCVDRVAEGHVATTFWGIHFISHDELLRNKGKYFHNDNVYFKVTYKDTPVLDLFLIIIVIVIIFCCICKCCTRC